MTPQLQVQAGETMLVEAALADDRRVSRRAAAHVVIVVDIASAATTSPKAIPAGSAIVAHISKAARCCSRSRPAAT